MSVLTPRTPGPPRHDEPADVQALEALIEEARRRARRRRRIYGASALVAAAVGLIGYFGFNSGGSTRPEVAREESSGPPRTPSQSAASSNPDGAIEGGLVSALAVNANDDVFAATLDAGVFKSANRGGSWRPLTMASNARRVDSLAIAPGEPQTVYAGTGGGVFKTTDGGATWQAANRGLFGEETAGERAHRLLEGYVYSLVVDPRDSETVYAGTFRRGLLKTTNGGANWQGLAPGMVGPVVLDPNDPETIYVGSVGASVGGGRAESGVSKSTDAGRTWQRVGLYGTNVEELAIDPKDSKVLYAGTAEGLLKSSDGGASWQAAGLANEGYVDRLAIDSNKPATLYAGANSGLFKSTDGGRTWEALEAGREARTGVSALALDPRNSATLYAGTGAGVLKSTDSGRSWEASTAGMTAARVGDLAAATRNSAYALVSSQGFFKRFRGGWRPANTGLPTLDLSVLAVDPQKPRTIYVVADTAEIFTTTSGGESWRRMKTPPISDTTEISALVVDPQDANTLYAGTIEWGDYVGPRASIFKSTNGGASWRALGKMTSPDHTSVLAVDPLDSQTVYAAGFGVFRSGDGGVTWESPVKDYYVRSLALDPSKPKTMYAGTDGGVFKSENGGVTWRDLEVEFGTGSVNALAVNPQTRRMISAGGDDGLFISNDGGDTWRRYQGDLGRRGIEALAFDPTGHTLYVGGISGGVVEVSLTGH